MLIQRVLTEGPFSMRQLAKQVGLSYDTLRSWAANRRTPQPDKLRQLAEGIRTRGDQLKELASELDAAVAAEGVGE